MLEMRFGRVEAERFCIFGGVEFVLVIWVMVHGLGDQMKDGVGVSFLEEQRFTRVYFGVTADIVIHCFFLRPSTFNRAFSVCFEFPLLHRYCSANLLFGIVDGPEIQARFFFALFRPFFSLPKLPVFKGWLIGLKLLQNPSHQNNTILHFAASPQLFLSAAL